MTYMCVCARNENQSWKIKKQTDRMKKNWYILPSLLMDGTFKYNRITVFYEIWTKRKKKEMMIPRWHMNDIYKKWSFNKQKINNLWHKNWKKVSRFQKKRKKFSNLQANPVYKKFMSVELIKWRESILKRCRIQQRTRQSN